MSTTERRATRSSIKKESPAPGPAKQEDSTAHANLQSDGEYDEPQGKKRKRTAKPKKQTAATKKSKGMQKTSKEIAGTLLEMPFDIHVEIFSYLEPFDLLNLGRTCNDFRGLVVSREFAAVWRQLRNSLWPTMPPCPDDITEPAFVELFFGRACMGCGSKPTPSAPIALYHCWEVRTRLCAKCIRLGWSEHNDLRGYGTNFIAKKDWAITQLEDLVPRCRLPSRRMKSNGVETLYSTRTVNEWKDAFQQQKNAPGKLAWVAKKKVQCQEIKMHAEKCAEWLKTVGAKIFAEEQRVLVEERQARVVDFLVSNGWEEELDRMENNHPINLPWVIKLCERKLTDKVLDTHKQQFEDYMKHEEKIRLNQEKIECIEQRLRQLGSLYEAIVYRELSLEVPHPRTGDIFAIPRFTDKVMNTPVNVKVTARHFTEIEDNLTGVMEEATNIVKTKMLALVEAGLSDKPYDPKTVLDLATTVFRNRYGYDARTILTTPAAMATHMANHPNDLMHKSAKKILRSVPWNSSKVMNFDRASHDILCSIMTFLGLNPQTTTLKEIQELDPMIECVECNDLHDGRLIMDWCHTAFHMQGYRAHPQGISAFEVLQGDDAIRARAALREQTRRRLYSLNPKPSTLCTHCTQYYQAPLDKMLWHLSTVHNIEYAADTDFKIAYQNEVKDYPNMQCRIWPPRAPTKGFS